MCRGRADSRHPPPVHIIRFPPLRHYTPKNPCITQTATRHPFVPSTLALIHRLRRKSTALGPGHYYITRIATLPPSALNTTRVPIPLRQPSLTYPSPCTVPKTTRRLIALALNIAAPTAPLKFLLLTEQHRSRCRRRRSIHPDRHRRAAKSSMTRSGAMVMMCNGRSHVQMLECTRLPPARSGLHFARAEM